MSKKLITRYVGQTNPFLENLAVHPILKRIYANRGINSADQLDCELKGLLPFNGLSGIHEAVSLLNEALRNQQSIVIIGDYDVDGATSTALMVLALRDFGAKYVDYFVPDRFMDGYGLTSEVVDFVKPNKSPDLIVTVDNGIASLAGVDTANASGIRVLITDHHLPGNQLPKASAIVNPNQSGDLFQSKHLSGVGVAFYVLMALRAKLREQNWFVEQGIPESNLANYLDLVALGTVADLVDMDQNNRVLVYQGMKRIQSGRCRPGIRALVRIANKQLSQLVISDLGYVVSPRLNAAGRLDDMSLGISCLLADDFETAKRIALGLDKLNQERKAIESEMRGEALTELKKLKVNEQQLPFGLCLLNREWHQGIIGILASRIKDQLHRPVIVFTKCADQQLKGSARSIEDVHIRNLLNDIAVEYPDMIVKFGGHATAAGLTLNENAYHLFKRIFDEKVSKRLEGKDLNVKLMSDGELSGDDFCVELVELMNRVAAWGPGFPYPVFDGKFRVLEQRLLGKKHLKCVLKLNDKLLDAIAFNVDTYLWPNPRCDFVHIVYHLDIDEFYGRKKVKLVVEYMEPI
jgi:single-stranded-DNA-specific exonuclease